MEEATINETAAPVETVTAPEQTEEQAPELTAEEMKIRWENAWEHARAILAAAGRRA